MKEKQPNLNYKKPLHIYLEKGAVLTAWLPEPQTGWNTQIFGRTKKEAMKLQEIFYEGDKQQKVRICYTNNKSINSIARISVENLIKITGIDYSPAEAKLISFHRSIEGLFDSITK